MRQDFVQAPQSRYRPFRFRPFLNFGPPDHRPHRPGARARKRRNLHNAPTGVALLLILLSAFTLASCGRDSPTQPGLQVAVRIDVTPATAILSTPGQSVKLQATVFDAGRQALSGSPISWTSTDSAVATVDADGLVTARGNGTVRITALSGGVAGQAQVTVYIPPSVDEIRIVSGEGQRTLPGSSLRDPIAVQVLGTDNRPISGARVVFAPGEGHGFANPDTVLSASDGTAETFWTLGQDAGIHTLAVSVSGRTIVVEAYSIDVEAELDALFAPPGDAELEAVWSDWATRDVSSSGVMVELEEAYDLLGIPADLKVVSHQVGGIRHFGAIVVPRGAEPASLPILIFNHGGDDGFSVEETMLILAIALGDMRSDFVFVLPSFRDETLRYGNRAWRSDGPASPWDYDVDDAIALVNVTMETVPQAIPGEYLVSGASRGGGVSMLMGARDDRILGIVSFFGPTHFMDSWARGLAENLIDGEPVDKPGVDYLKDTYVLPWWIGDLPLADARLALIRRSAVFYAEELPPLQIHHGDMDDVVSVSQAESMIMAMADIGRGAPDFEGYIYPGGTHDFATLAAAVPRAVVFIQRLLGASGA